MPEFRERLDEMKAIGPEWAALVDHWPELEAMYRVRDTTLYDRVKAILEPIESTNPNLVKIGKHGAIYFGT